MQLWFWRWLHRRLEAWWHWVYYAKISPADYPEMMKQAQEQSGRIYTSRVGFRTPPLTYDLGDGKRLVIESEPAGGVGGGKEE